jgi:hypothetical protein
MHTPPLPPPARGVRRMHAHTSSAPACTCASFAPSCKLRSSCCNAATRAAAFAYARPVHPVPLKGSQSECSIVQEPCECVQR